MWIDPRDATTPFGDFGREFLDAIESRLEPGTAAKYWTMFNNQLAPQWETWPLIGIYNGHVEIEKWVSTLHEDYADSTVSTVFALFSSIMKAAFKAHCIPANPCVGIRVTSGEYTTERFVATPVQMLRAAMRLYERVGLPGFVLCLMDAYTGCRWGELAGQQRHEYDAEHRAIVIRQPLKEVNGALTKGGTGSDHP